MNQTTIIGRLAKDPESKVTPNGVNLCEFTVAVDGKEDTIWFRVTAWRKLGDICAQYLKKGKQVLIQGPVSCRAYMGKDGEPKAQMEITADKMEMLAGNKEDLMNAKVSQKMDKQAEQEAARQRLEAKPQEVVEDDLPF